MTTKYINGSGLSKLLQLISNSVGQALNSISNKLSNIDNTHANLIWVSYDELYDMRTRGKLIPGQYYRITDYFTTTSQENTMSDERGRNIIVLATDYRTLSEEAMTEDGCKVWYCIDNDTSRFAWAGATKPVLHFRCMYNEDGHTNTGDFIRDESLVIEESDITYYGYTFSGGSNTNIFNKNSVLWYTEEFPEITDDFVPHTFYQISDGEMVPINLNSRFYEEKEKIGKGVIYRMIDENGNDCPYDFKSIMFKNPNDETDDKYYYTFGSSCRNNIIKYYKQGYTLYIPNNTFGGGCYNNTFGNNCYNNTFGAGCYNNTFGEKCYDNTFDGGNRDNTFGNNCYNNTFGVYCLNNVFGAGCYNNTFGKECYNNTFGEKCYDNNFGADCYNNTFGNSYRDNTFGNNCYNNTFGNNCYNNSFIYVNSSDSTQTEILNGIDNCDFSNEYQYNELKHLKKSNTIISYYLRNVHFCKGIKGRQLSNLNIEYNTITIEGTLPDKTETKVAKNSKGELKIYCEADLIA